MLLDAEILREIAAAPVEKRAITNLRVLNEAFDYGSAFSRGLRIDLNGLTILLISGTASIDEYGKTVHIGDFRAQQRRTYDNITGLLAAEGATTAPSSHWTSRIATSAMRGRRWVCPERVRRYRIPWFVRACVPASPGSPAPAGCVVPGRAGCVARPASDWCSGPADRCAWCVLIVLGGER